MDVQFPDTPESVALALFVLLFMEGRDKERNVCLTTWALDLFAQCLSAANGHRCMGEIGRLH